jgi:hypothetical protein
MHEPVFEYGFMDHAVALSNGHENHELGLHVRGEPWIGKRLDVRAYDALVPFHPHPLVTDFNQGASLAELIDDTTHVLGLTPRQGPVHAVHDPVDEDQHQGCGVFLEIEHGNGGHSGQESRQGDLIRGYPHLFSQAGQKF